jgi:hypothetical protein
MATSKIRLYFFLVRACDDRAPAGVAKRRVPKIIAARIKKPLRAIYLAYAKQ